MGDVLIALAPAFAAGLWFFGLSALLVVLASTAACVATDWALGGRAQLADLSAVVTGVLVGLILPPSLPLWMAALGGFVAIALGKAAWGGLGQNLFNPALVGRAFLQAAFPIALDHLGAAAGPARALSRQSRPALHERAGGCRHRRHAARPDEVPRRGDAARGPLLGQRLGLDR